MDILAMDIVARFLTSYCCNKRLFFMRLDVFFDASHDQTSQR